jgi:hypothetical protein
MKKGLLIGCSALLLLVVIGGAFAWFKVLAPMMRAGSEIVSVVRQVEQFERLNRDVRNQRPYSAPADGVLSPAQVDAVLGVQRHIKQGMAERFKELEERYQRLEADLKASGRQPGIEDLARAYGDLFGLIIDAKRLQVEALNRQGVSLAEYQWARAVTLQAAGISASGVLQLDADTQQQIRVRHGVNDENLQLVQPHAKELLETAVVAALGL